MAERVRRSRGGRRWSGWYFGYVYVERWEAEKRTGDEKVPA